MIASVSHLLIPALVLLYAGAVSGVSGAEPPKCAGKYESIHKIQGVHVNCAVATCATIVAPFTSNKRTCVSSCEDDDSCNCAVFEDGACSHYWPFCDAAVLGLTKSDSANLAIQPCSSYPAEAPKSSEMESEHGECEPLKLYKNVMITAYGCDSASCNATASTATVSADECFGLCVSAGYDVCRSATYVPANANLPEPSCVMYDVRLEDMGVHAFELVHDSALGAVTASYCKPPEAHLAYPAGETTQYGVDWDAMCESGAVVVAVPDMIHLCQNCAFIPEKRADRQLGSPGYFYYPSEGLEECMGDCEGDARCGCAYYRANDADPLGEYKNQWCALTTVPCNQEDIGAKYDTQRIHTAIHKCAYSADAMVQDTWGTEPYVWIDWYGVWDYVCESNAAFDHGPSNSACGPSCVLEGSYTTKEEDLEACKERCLAVDTCGCSYWEAASGFCTLMWGGDSFGKEQELVDAEACIANSNDAPKGMFFDPNEATSNTVSEICCHDCGLEEYYYI